MERQRRRGGWTEGGSQLLADASNDVRCYRMYVGRSAEFLVDPDKRLIG